LADFTGDVRRDCGVRRSISAALGHDSEREVGGKAEGSGGFIGAALVDNQGVGNARGNDSGDVTGRGEGEVVTGVMTGGSHLSAREREKEGTGSG
jgi:hypothetical protein